MVIFKFLKKNNLLYKHCIFISSPGQTKDGHLTGSRDFFSFFLTVITTVNAREYIIHNRFLAKRIERVINCDLLYHIIELLKFSAWIIQSPFLLHQYDYILHAFIFTCPPIINHVSDQYSVCFCLHIPGCRCQGTLYW